jgi:hypothetical protein
VIALLQKEGGQMQGNEYASKLRPVSVMLQRGLQSQQPISG